MINGNYIRLHRKLVDWEWFTKPNHVVLFINLLLRANYMDKEWQGRIIKRGSLSTSIDSLAAQTGLSIQNVRTVLKNLVLTGDLTREVTGPSSIITICHYETYQYKKDEPNIEPNRQSNHQLTGNLTPLKELKNLRTKESNLKKEIHKEKKESVNVLEPLEKPSPDSFQRFKATYQTIKPFSETGNLVFLKSAFYQAVAEVGEDKVLLAAEDCSYSYQVTNVAVRFRKSPEKWLEEKQYNIGWNYETERVLGASREPVPAKVADRIFKRLRFLHKTYPEIKWEN